MKTPTTEIAEIRSEVVATRENEVPHSLLKIFEELTSHPEIFNFSYDIEISRQYYYLLLRTYIYRK